VLDPDFDSWNALRLPPRLERDRVSIRSGLGDRQPCAGRMDIDLRPASVISNAITGGGVTGLVR
jgi:hypothetical protein